MLDADFSGRDGVRLDVHLGQPRISLGALKRVTLSAARPNPFAGTTRFSVTIAQAGVLDVGVFDLAGRRAVP